MNYFINNKTCENRKQFKWKIVLNSINNINLNIKKNKVFNKDMTLI